MGLHVGASSCITQQRKDYIHMKAHKETLLCFLNTDSLVFLFCESPLTLLSFLVNQTIRKY